MKLKCHACGAVVDTAKPVVQCEPRIGAYVMTVDEYWRGASRDEADKLVRARFTHQQVYTHVDVFSPPELGENFLYRVKL